MKALAKALCALLPLVALASTAACSAPDDGDDATEEATSAVAPAKLDVYLRIVESKLIFDTHVEAFGVKKGTALDITCRDEHFDLVSKPSLFDAGWTPEKALDFAETVQGARYRDYVLASCRNASTQVLGWFGKGRDIELSVSDTLLNERYEPSELPLVFEYTTLGSDAAPTYYSCDSDFTRTQLDENDDAKLWEVSVSCKRRQAPTKKELGPIDFVKHPGIYASVSSYESWMLPPVAGTQASVEHVRDALLAQVGEGKYSGAMKTLSKACGLEITKTADGLAISHTIKSSNRTRTLELKAENLLGFVEGDLFSDPIRASGELVGKFAAVETRDSKGDSTVIRFEKNTTLDALVVRIDGSEAYCRRLVAE